MPLLPFRTHVRLIDDLVGPEPDQVAPPSGAGTIRAATNYETHIQPAILGLRKALDVASAWPIPGLGGARAATTAAQFGPKAIKAADMLGKLSGKLSHSSKANAALASKRAAINAAMTGLGEARNQIEGAYFDSEAPPLPEAPTQFRSADLLRRIPGMGR